ncbi:MAG: methionine--tRNA ligase [Planctomycetota bacterium]|jgi:methionyl-tRNA synthetase
MSDPQRYLVTSALPYANGRIHVGHVAGAYLPADIYVRFLRSTGRDVLYVCGSDEHGVPITIAADKAGVTPKEIVDRYHGANDRAFAGLDIDFDVYGRTTSKLHAEGSREFFLKLHAAGHIEDKIGPQLYCPKCDRFLPDRYVHGTCPNAECGFNDAKGDQCEACGRDLSTLELVAPRCAICDQEPQPRDTRHWYLKLGDFQDRLDAWLGEKEGWRDNIGAFCKGVFHEGLRSRAITRDISWGIPVPLEEATGKVLYVWFDAPIGYISFTRELFAERGDPEGWKRYWCDPGSAVIHFIGKDNIVFHAMTWPAMLMGHGGINLPANVVANEFLNVRGRKSSKSRNWAVWVEEYLERFPVDPLRYYLTANAPEGRDTDFRWEDFQQRNNSELAATLGNFAHRTLSFAGKYFDGVAPERGEPDGTARDALAEVEAATGEVRAELEGFRFKAGLQRLMKLAQSANRYFDAAAPWKSRKTDMAACGSAISVCLALVDRLAALMYPFLPGSAARLEGYLGRDPGEAPRQWDSLGDGPAPGTKLGKPEPLFRQIEDEEIEAANARLG